jgi:hypothetical protein
MIFWHLLLHRFLKTWRSPAWGKNILVFLLNILGFSFMIFSIPLLGYHFADFIFEIRPDLLEPVSALGSFLIGFFYTMVLWLILGLKIPENQPYIYWLLPKYKKALAWNELFPSIFHTGQNITLLFIFPFVYQYVLPIYGWLSSIVLIFSLFAMNSIIGLGMYAVKKTFSFFKWTSLIMVLIAVIMYYFFKIIQIDTELWGQILIEHLIKPDWISVSILLVMMCIVFMHSYKIAIQSFYFDKNLNDPSIIENDRIGESWLTRLPIDLVYLIRLMGYNQIKRPSFLITLAFYQIFMLLYWLKPNFFDSTLSLMMYFQLFGSGLMLNNFPQFFMCNTAYFDGLVSRNIPVERLLRVHYGTMLALYLLLFVCWSPFIFHTQHYWLLAALTLFHSGFTSCIYLINSYIFSKRVEIGSAKPNKANGKLIGGSMAALVLIWSITLFLYGVVGTVFGYQVSLYSIAIVGIFFIISHPLWMRDIMLHFKKYKYERLEEFRKI